MNVLKFAWALACSIVALAAPGFAQTPAFPDRSIRLVVAFPPGGATDVIARVLAQGLTTELGQITLNAFAAPRSGGLWREVVPELVTKLRADGAHVGQAAGEWGEEIEAVTI